MIESKANEAFKMAKEKNGFVQKGREGEEKKKNTFFVVAASAHLVVQQKRNWYNCKGYAVMLIGHVAQVRFIFSAIALDRKLHHEQ